MNSQSTRERRAAGNIEEYLQHVSEIIEQSRSDLSVSPALAFRGQKCHSWKLASSAERRLGGPQPNSGSISDKEFIEYHENLILAYKKNRFDRRDGEQFDELEVLAQLQHFMAATCLIDFTRNALVALWFACESSGQDGKVFVVNTANDAENEHFWEVSPLDIEDNTISQILNFETRNSDDEQSDDSVSQEGIEPDDSKPNFWHWVPANLNERIPAQHSLFIFGSISSGKPETKKIIVLSAKKEQIRKELKEVHNIHEDTLFPDFFGFAYTQRHDAPYGPTAEEYQGLGDRAFQMGDYSQAVQHFSSSIQRKPNEYVLYELRGNAYLRLRDFQSAIQDFSKMIELRPGQYLGYARRGNAYLRLRDFQSAIQDFSKVIELRPDQNLGYARRGNAYLRLRDFQSAIQDFSKMIELRPGHYWGYRLRGGVYERQDELDKAKDDYSKVIELNPNRPLGYRLRGGVYERQDELDRAKDDYSEAIKLEPQDFRAYLLRGRVYRKQGDIDNSVQDFNRGLALNPRNLQALRAGARANLESKDFIIAISYLDRVIELRPKDPSDHGMRAVANSCLEQWDQARSDFSLASDLGLNIAGFFRDEFGSVPDFEKRMDIQLPEDILSMLVE